MMKIEHVALWVDDLEKMRAFYEKYFWGRAGEKYVNPSKGFSSYFVSFESGARLELMKLETTENVKGNGKENFKGFAHFAISVGSRETVDSLTEELMKAGFEVVGSPRTTGDGYYESVILDPEGNRIEITE